MKEIQKKRMAKKSMRYHEWRRYGRLSLRRLRWCVTASSKGTNGLVLLRLTPVADVDICRVLCHVSEVEGLAAGSTSALARNTKKSLTLCKKSRIEDSGSVIRPVTIIRANISTLVSTDGFSWLLHSYGWGGPYGKAQGKLDLGTHVKIMKRMNSA
jgi:hypothetical protein